MAHIAYIENSFELRILNTLEMALKSHINRQLTHTVRNLFVFIVFTALDMLLKNFIKYSNLLPSPFGFRITTNNVTSKQARNVSN